MSLTLLWLLASGVEDNLQEVVGHITEGVCRPLKVKPTLVLFSVFSKRESLHSECVECVADVFAQVRIEQVIVAEPGAVLLYKLSNLLKFYHHTIRYLDSAAAKHETSLSL